MLEDLTLTLLFSWFLLFARVGSAMAFLPAFGEGFVPIRMRLLIALMISVVLTPVLKSIIPPMPGNVGSLLLLLLGEITIGVIIGLVGKLWLSVMHLYGMIVATQMGLASGILFDPSSQTQGAIIGVFLNLLAILLIFVTNTHHLFLQGMVDTYHIFAPGKVPLMQDVSVMITNVVAASFLAGFKLSSPFIIVGLLINLGSGVISRLMPSMQVFFIIMPLQIAVGFFILLLTLSASMLWFIDILGEQALTIFSPE